MVVPRSRLHARTHCNIWIERLNKVYRYNAGSYLERCKREKQHYYEDEEEEVERKRAILSYDSVGSNYDPRGMAILFKGESPQRGEHGKGRATGIAARFVVSRSYKFAGIKRKNAVCLDVRSTHP